MDKDRANSDELENLQELSRKYNHYADAEEFVSPKTSDSPASDEMVFEDISSYSEGNADFYMNPKKEDAKSNVDKKSKRVNKSEGNFFSRNKYRNTKIIALSLLIALLVSLSGFFVYVIVITGKGVWNDDGLDFNNPDDSQEIYDDNHDWQVMGDVDAGSINEFLFSWANNSGEKMYSKNVINVLLCGVDSETGEADSGRSDIMMLVSINKKLKKITMVSFLRDSWTYMRVPRENGTSYDYYFKMNAAYNLGGPATLLQTIENNYKIKIDEFLAVDFKSFPKLIDALGGVEVDVQDYEANFIRRTSSQKDFPYGTAKLNGKQALIYSRIRKCDADSDISRTRRQRSVIKGLIDSAKSATKGQLLNAFKQVSGYIRTGYTQTEVFALIAQAFANDWMQYEMVELVLPSEDYVDRASTKINGQSCWVVDYALCAQKLQTALYGESNIVLDDDRTGALDLLTNRREPTSTTTKSYYNNDYDTDDNDNYYNNDDSNNNDNNNTDNDSDSNNNGDSNDNSNSDNNDNNSDGNDTSNDNGSGYPDIEIPSFSIPTINIPNFDSSEDTENSETVTESEN